MKTIKIRSLWLIWAAMYIVTAGLGFIPEPRGFGMALLLLLGLAFFVPPALLLHRSLSTGDKKLLARLRVLSLISLSATLVLWVLNVLSALMSKAMGVFLNILLGLVSAPMLCIQFRGLSMFLWACLLMSCLILGKKNR